MTKKNPSPKKFEKIGRVTSASVCQGTGKTWDEWIKILDQSGARTWTHQEIVAILKKKFKLNLWWQQGVTSGYETAIGRRIEGQTLKGDYSTVATRTFELSHIKAWKLISSSEGTFCWLKPLTEFTLKAGAPFEAEGEIYGEVRTVKKNRRVRLRWYDSDWPKATVVQVSVVARPNKKCIVVIDHTGLPSERARVQMREHWKSVLTQLAELGCKSP